MTVRDAFVRLHRWVGLAMALFLVIAGLTGSIIAFNHELDAWLNPELYHVDTRGQTKSPLDLAAQIQAGERDRYVSYVPLEVEPGHALVLGLRVRPDRLTGQSSDTASYEMFVNPITGATLGERTWGVCCFERKHIIPFLYSIHYSLHLPELWGMRVMGVVAIAWMIDCFVGFYLTLPGKKSSSSSSFWSRWKSAWQIKRDANRYRVNFDVHRAVGLWLWLLFFTIAISGVYLALRFEVFRPALAMVMSISPDPFEQAPATGAATGTAAVGTATVAAGGSQSTAVTYQSIVATATEEGRRRGWKPPFDVFHSPEFGLYGVGFGDHHAAGIGVPYLYFDANTGKVRTEFVPGQGTIGDVFMQTMFPLHSGQIVGLPGRILISFSGIAVVVLTVTGVVIWAKKRKGRQATTNRTRSRLAA
jgi:uncharacterized iron-regulated membrane protein